MHACGVLTMIEAEEYACGLPTLVEMHACGLFTVIEAEEIHAVSRHWLRCMHAVSS